LGLEPGEMLEVAWIESGSLHLTLKSAVKAGLRAIGAVFSESASASIERTIAAAAARSNQGTTPGGDAARGESSEGCARRAQQNDPTRD
jgi:hypothetical protein